MDKRSRHLALFALCIFFGSGVIQLASADGQWCVASQGALDTDLQTAINYACGVADCSSIQPGAICYDPNTLRDHASYAFNEYYQKNPQPDSCVFGGVATLTSTDPSHGNCQFTSGGTSISSPLSKPTPSSPDQPTHGSSPTRPNPTPPSPRQQGYPSGATSTSYSLLVFLACGLLALLQIAKSI